MKDPYIPQAQLGRLEGSVAANRVVVLYGPRRVGKTTLIREYRRRYDPEALLVSGEEIAVREYLESQSLAKLRALVGRWRTLIVEEAQYVRQVGLNLKLLRLVQLLAFQVGRETSVSELGNRLGMSKNTVGRYLDLLEKAYVIYGRMGFSRNLRKEIAKSRRYYFYDNGIRNGLVNNFNSLSMRDDAGLLWENYVQVERLKFNLYTGRFAQSYFWRTYDRQEIDLVEEHGGRLYAAGIKWSVRSGARAPESLA